MRRNCLSVDSREKGYFREARQKAPSCQNVLSNALIVGEVGKIRVDLTELLGLEVKFLIL